MNDFMTPDILATFAGMVAAVTVIVQFSKSIIKKNFADYAVRLYAFAVSLVLTFIFARTGQGVQGIVLTIINAIIVTVSSTGAYEMIADPKAEKAKADNIKQE